MNEFGLLLWLCAAVDCVSPASSAAVGQQTNAIDAGLDTRTGRLMRKEIASNDGVVGAEEGRTSALVDYDGLVSYLPETAHDDRGAELDYGAPLSEETLTDLDDDLDPGSLSNSSLLEEHTTWGRRRRRRRRGARGPPGPRGPPGASVRGGIGHRGARGATGAKGAPGARGATGAKGDTPKPIDCVWADWAAYSDCTKSCGPKEDPGTQVRSRDFKVLPQNGGKNCEGSQFETAKCKVKACPTTTTTTTTTTKAAAKSSTVPLHTNCLVSLILFATASFSLLS